MLAVMIDVLNKEVQEYLSYEEKIKCAREEAGIIISVITSKYLEKRFPQNCGYDGIDVLPRIKIHNQILGIDVQKKLSAKIIAEDFENNIIDEIELEYRERENVWYIRKNQEEFSFLCKAEEFQECRKDETSGRKKFVVNFKTIHKMDRITEPKSEMIQRYY